uniref:Methyltransferase-like protein 4 n=1 Tax=Parascaris univalens TaxID=6257 RepID=A0A914ZLT9_PARUN
ENPRYVRAIGNDFMIMDELAYYTLLYDEAKLQPNEDFYALRSPFRMRSQIEAEKNAAITGKVRRKRKRNGNPNTDPDFIELCKDIEMRYLRIIAANSGCFERSEHKLEDENNEQARMAVSCTDTSGSSSDILDYIALKSEPSLSDYRLSTDYSIIERVPDECTLWVNECLRSVFLTCGSQTFVIPSKSSFIIGDVSLSRHLIARGMLYDLIVMDPPWTNKSVKRRKPYTTFNECELLELRISELLKESGLLAIWVTNNKKLKGYVDEVIQSFSLVKVATCHWLKVTTSGEPVCAFQPHHKVPFETFVLACKQSFFDHYSAAIGSNFLLISTPSAIHSRKPPLLPLLKAINAV